MVYVSDVTSVGQDEMDSGSVLSFGETVIEQEVISAVSGGRFCNGKW